MALTMEKRTVEGERTVGLNRVQVPVRCESAPTGVREAAEVLWEDARLYLSGVTAQDGGILAEGTLFCQALYRLEGDSALRTAQCETPLQEVVEMEAARRGMTARCTGEIEHLEAEYAGGRVVFSAAVDLTGRVSEGCEAEIVESAGGDGLETHTESFTLRRLAGESGAAASLRDEVSLPSALQARGVLVSRCAVRNIAAEREEGGVRVGGEALVEALVRCGVEERPVAMVKYVMPFQQAVPFPEDTPGQPQASVQVKRLTCQLDDDPEDAAIRIACELDMRVEMYDRKDVTAVTDAYGTRDTDVEVQTAPLAVCTGSEAAEGRAEFRGELLLGEGSLGVGAVLAVRAMPYVSEAEGDTVRGVVEAVCLYVPAGREQVACVRGENPFELRLDRPLPDGAGVRVEASDADAISVVSDRLEVRCTLAARGDWQQEKEIAAATAMTEVPAQRNPAAIVIRYAGAGDTLWDIARRYRASVEEVKALNPGMDTPKAGQPVIVWT